MSDTIELLETIGNDASLRHAPKDDLATRLERMGASAALMTAASSGDGKALYAELGHVPMQHPQITHAPGHEDDEPGHEDDAEPTQISAPDQGNSSSPAK
jgi:hypothetical protein